MDFVSLAKARYSCRKLSDKPVEEEKINKIIEAIVCAPTACNIQPFKVWVIKSEEMLEKVSQTTNFTFDSKTILALGTKSDKAWVRPFDGMNYADVDGTIVGTQIMLAVQDLGLGTTWVGYFDAPMLKSLIPEMQGYNMIGLFPIGYPADDAVPAPMHTKSKPTEELVKMI